MTMVMRYANHEARAAAIANGFTDSLDEIYGRLEALPLRNDGPRRLVRDYKKLIDVSRVMILIAMGGNMLRRNAHP